MEHDLLFNPEIGQSGSYNELCISHMAFEIGSFQKLCGSNYDIETLNNWQHPNYHQYDSEGANYELYCLLGVDRTAPISGES